MTLVHWDDVDAHEITGYEPIAGRWQRLADAAGSVRVGMQRVVIDAGRLTTPPHVHSMEEEIVHVLAGTGTLWQDGKTSDVAAGDTIVHTASSPAHTLIGGADGLDVLVFGTRLRPESGYLPRTRAAWLARTWVTVNEGSPWAAESALGVPTGEPAERPPNVVALADVEGEYGGIWKPVGREAGAVRTGLNWVNLPPHEESAAPHCHSADEEVFVVLDGEGTFELWGPPTAGEPPATEPLERHRIRRGHVVSRPASTAKSHCFRTGESGMTYLAYGTREPNDVCYYPRSNKIYFRGLGLLARLEPLDYFDGEPA